MQPRIARFRPSLAVPAIDDIGEVPAERQETRQEGSVEGYSDVQFLMPDTSAGTKERPFPPGLPVAGARRPHGVVHGFHAKSAVSLANPMGCDTCVLAAIKKKNPRHPLACREARKHSRCSILERHQSNWVAGLVDEIRTATGGEPTALQRGAVEQIVRLRSRLFALETYLAAAGVVDVRTGEPRAIVDRMTSLENALGRATGELRSSIADARAAKRGGAPSLTEYLAALATRNAAPLAVEDATSKEIERKEILSEEDSDGSDE